MRNCKQSFESLEKGHQSFFKSYDNHHPFFERKAQSKYKAGKFIVNAPSFPILMDYDIHHFELHPNCRKMPIFQKQTLEIVRANFEPKENPLETIDSLIDALGVAECSKELTFKEQQLANFASECLQKQIPYIKYGMLKIRR